MAALPRHLIFRGLERGDSLGCEEDFAMRAANPIFNGHDFTDGLCVCGLTRRLYNEFGQPPCPGRRGLSEKAGPADDPPADFGQRAACGGEPI